jgi:prepilin-type N-terminal cleavage/methylation domain-containing protein
MANGFSLVELILVVAILGVLAAVVIPMSAGATQQARETSLADNLREMRLAIEKYRAEHFGLAPGVDADNVAASPTEKMLVLQLTRLTSSEGVLLAQDTAGLVCGPYLAAIPENPMNGNAAIRVIALGAKNEALKPDGVQGWLYHDGDCRIMSNVAGKCRDGTRYEDM